MDYYYRTVKTLSKITLDSIFSKYCHIIFFNFIGLYLFLFLTPCIALSSEKFDAGFLKDNPDKPWHIVADEINYDEKTFQYIAEGNVVISKNDMRLNADHIRFDHKTMDAAATGNVVLSSMGNVISGTKMEINLNTKTGTMYNGKAFFKKENFHISGSRICKTGDQTYTIDKATFSTCDGDHPAWKITGRRLKITIEGYGFISHAALWAKRIPALYTPFFAFPVKLKRQTGLLPPGIGWSDRKGVEYAQPFYWAINESSDATIYAHHMSSRGNKLGMEYRYTLGDITKGTFMYDYLDDRRVDDGTPGSSEDWGYEDDDELRPNQSRYWFRMKHNQELPGGFLGRMDIDIVSDQDYLHEFKNGHTGFNSTKDYFAKEFNREIDDYDDTERINSLYVGKNWSTYSLNIEGRWYDNVINRRWRDIDTTLQKLPVMEFNGSKQKIPVTPLYFDLDSEYTYFYSADGNRGHRIDIHPRFYLPLKFKNFFSFEPSIGIEETAWSIDEYDESSRIEKKTYNRQLYDIKLDMSTEVYNVFKINTDFIDSIKHTIRPQIIYEYVPDKNQDRFPSFDSLDRIEKKNLITCSITNAFTSKSLNTPEKDKEKNPATGEDENYADNQIKPKNYTYRQFCRFKLEQSYDVNESREDDKAEFADKENKRPFSPVYGEFEFDPVKYLSIRSDAEWSIYENEFETRNIAVRLSDKRGDKLFFEHRYARNENRNIYTEFLFKFSDRFWVFLEHERNQREAEDIKSGVGLLYISQCWSINFGCLKEEDDIKYAFMINLYGLGGFGKPSIIQNMFKNPFESKR